MSAKLSHVVALVQYGGAGRHIATLHAEPAVLVQSAKMGLAYILLYFLAVTLPKLAILSLYLRVFPQRPYRLASYMLGAILLASYIANTLTACFICTPVRAFWNHSLPGARCINENLWFRCASVPNLVTDIGLLLLPLPIVWRIKTSIREKIGLTLTFCTGSM